MDNTTPFHANEYDLEMARTMPFYAEFFNQTIDLVKTLKIENASWLDTGCGTGSFISTVVTLKEFNKFQFVLCDPSKEMIDIAKNKLSDCKLIEDFCVCGSQELDYKDKFGVITAIQAHHYMNYNDRIIAVEKCYEALEKDGICVIFENFAPNCEKSKNIALSRWEQFQLRSGKSENEAKLQYTRYGKNFFPITLSEHLNILKNCGFQTAEIFWLSYMQVGIYAIK